MRATALTLLLCGILSRHCEGIIPKNTAPASVGCVEYGVILKRSIVEAVALYFSENPLPNRPPFSPSMLMSLDAINLYKDYYGEGATPEAFVRVMLDILYAAAGCRESGNTDKVMLRTRVYTYAIEQNFESARRQFGILLRHDISDFGDGNWKSYHCVTNKDVKLAEAIILTEIARLRREVGEWSFGKFFGLGTGTTLAFAIDDTGSMTEEIEAARRRSNLLIDQRVGSLDQPRNFVLVPFNDPKVGPVTSTGDPKRLKQAFEQVSAHNGGDLPELSMRGISLALEKCLPGSTIYIITDAEAKDAELQDQVIATAMKKRIKLVFLLTNRMSSWLCAGFASIRRLAACRDPSLKLGFELYEHLANSTGGEVLVIRRSNIFKATELIDISLKHALVNLETRTLLDGDHSIEIFVDSSIKELNVRAFGSCESIKLRSNGTPLQFAVSVKVSDLFIGSVNITNFGKYRLVVKASERCRVTITAKSTKGFTQSLAKDFVNDTTSQCSEVIDDHPISSEKVIVLVDAYGFHIGDVFRTISFLDEKTGEVLYSFRVQDGSKRHFRIRLDPFQKKKLLAYVSGVDSNGFQFRRLADRAIRFVNAQIDCSALDQSVFRAGTPLQIPITVRNVANESEYYTIGAMDDKKFITSVSQARILVPAGGSARFFLRLRARSETKVGTLSRITITVKGRDGTLVYKECEVIVLSKQAPGLEYFSITSNINTRFAETIIQSKFVNDGWSSREAVFFVVVPKNAFITEFTMTVGGETYPGEIKEIGEAKRFYSVGKREGLTLGSVSASADDTLFQTSVNLRGDEDVIFQLKYQQQLIRIGGKYTHEIHVQPGYPAGTLTIEINLWESLPITSLRILNLKTEQFSLPGGVSLKGVKVIKSGNSAKITYSATKEQQTELSPFGMNGRFGCEYDLVRLGDTVSDMVVSESNFVHFIVPQLAIMTKRVVFLLDNSGSMFGRKMQQLRNAMFTLLEGLNPEDSFAILMFNSKVQSWDPHPGDDTRSIMVSATPANVANAKRFLNSVTPQAETDLLKGIELAINVMEGFVQDEKLNPHYSTDFIFVLSDGPATEGQTDSDLIVSTITSLNKLKFAIHTIAFGALADTTTLSAIASKNKGSYIQIYQDLDSSQKISHFFESFAHPMLRDIRIRYPSGRLIPLTKTNFEQYQRGTEMVVAGRFANVTKCLSSSEGSDDAKPVDFTLSAKTDDEDVYVEEGVIPVCDENEEELQEFIERREKYLQLVDTLTELEEEENKTVVNELEEKVFNLSKQNNFVVRDHTALVVAKPDDLKEVDETIAAELEEAAKLSAVSSTTTRPTLPTTTARTLPGSVVTPAFGRITLSTLTPFTASRPRLEFFGDPHFVIDIEQQITLCFNWEGQEGQNINLLHDPVKGITVNGRLVTSKAPKTSARPLRTYVNKLGIFLQKQNISIVVTSKDVVLRTADKSRISLPFGKYGFRRRKSVILKVRPVTKFKSTLFIHLHKKLVFRVISRINSKSEFVKDHLDFAVLRGDGLSESSVGVLGQFSRFKADEKVPASIEFRSDGKTALLWYRHNPIEVASHTLRDYNSDKEVECWYMADKKQLWENDEELFVVKGILDPPKTVKLDHR